MSRLARRARVSAGPAARRCFASAVTVSLPSIAVVGTGRMGQLRVEGIKADGASRLGWVVDSDVEAAKALGDKWDTQHTDDLSEALADDTVDAVWLSTPTPTHVDLIMQSLAAGKAVVVEKPVATTPEEINACYDAAEAAGLPLVCSFQRRFDPTYVALKAAVQAGDIGSLQNAHCVFRDHPLPPIEFLKVGGDIFHDLICHDSDYIAWVAGEQPVSVLATGTSHIAELRELGIFDAATAVLQYPSGMICTMDLNRGCAFGYDQRAEVMGNLGMLQIGNQSDTSLITSTASGISGHTLMPSFPERFERAYRLELEHVVDVLTTGAEPVNTPPLPSPGPALLTPMPFRSSWSRGGTLSCRRWLQRRAGCRPRRDTRSPSRATSATRPSPARACDQAHSVSSPPPPRCGTVGARGGR